MNLLLFVIACTLVGTQAQFFGSQSATSIQNNQFAAGMGGGSGGASASFDGMNAVGGMFRKKRQFFGAQSATNIQNNQFAAGMGGGSGASASFGDMSAMGGFSRGGGASVSVNGGGSSVNVDDGARKKRQFFGAQSATNIQNNQFAAGMGGASGASASFGGMSSMRGSTAIRTGGFTGGSTAIRTGGPVRGSTTVNVDLGNTHINVDDDGARKKRQFFSTQSATNIQNNQFAAGGAVSGGGSAQVNVDE